MKTRIALTGLYLGAFSACLVLLVAGALVLSSDPVVWARAWWQMTLSWAGFGMVFLRIGKALNRPERASGRRQDASRSCESITIADPRTKRLLRAYTLLGFVLVAGFAYASWCIAPRYLQLGGEVDVSPSGSTKKLHESHARNVNNYP